MIPILASERRDAARRGGEWRPCLRPHSRSRPRPHPHPRAAERGDIAAQANLGALYANGWGVERDDVLAHMWLNLAASGAKGRRFRRSLIRKRDRIAGRLTPERIAEAQRLAQDWRPK